MSLNKVILIGRLGQNPELITNNTNLCKLSIATEQKWTDKQGNKKSETTWHKVTFFGNPAVTLAQHTKKGDEIYIEGRIQNRSWEQDGQKRYSTEIIGESFQFLDNKKDSRDLDPY